MRVQHCRQAPTTLPIATSYFISIDCVRYPVYLQEPDSSDQAKYWGGCIELMADLGTAGDALFPVPRSRYEASVLGHLF